jgi:hypothetical protein
MRVFFCSFAAFVVMLEICHATEKNVKDERTLVENFLQEFKKSSNDPDRDWTKFLDPSFLKARPVIEDAWSLKVIDIAEIQAIEAQGDGRVVAARLRQSDGKDCLIIFLVQKVGDAFYIDPPLKQDPFSLTVVPWHFFTTF